MESAPAQRTAPEGRLLTSSEVARRLGIHRVSVYRHVADGSLVARRLGPSEPFRFEPAAIERFLEDVRPTRR